MGIQVEFNPDLALRNIVGFKSGNRKNEECIPENMQSGNTYEFLKKGLRNYWIHGELPLIETNGNQQLSRPNASLIITETTHFLLNGEPYTKGKYKVIKVFNSNDSNIYFEGFNRVKG